MKNNRQRLVLMTLIVFLLFLVIYVSGLFISNDSIAGNYFEAKQSPSLQHWFGTDALGRDLFLRTLKGLSMSITIGLIASSASALIAIFIGMGTATKRPWIDAIINWMIDLIMSVPHLILIILISFAFNKGFKGLLIGIIATHWCSLARLIRSEVLQLRNQQYIAISKTLGKSNGWIFIHHFLPHLFPQFLVGLILLFPHTILHEAAISFLGFGLPPEQPAIGIILSESMRYLSVGMWWPAVLPGLTLICIVLLVDRLGSYLQMILDPVKSQQ